VSRATASVFKGKMFPKSVELLNLRGQDRRARMSEGGVDQSHSRGRHESSLGMKGYHRQQQQRFLSGKRDKPVKTTTGKERFKD